MPLSLIPGLLLANLKVEDIIALLNLAMGIFAKFGDGDQRLTDLRNEVQRWVDEDRTPTDAEIDALMARSDAAHERIQNA